MDGLFRVRVLTRRPPTAAGDRLVIAERALQFFVSFAAFVVFKRPGMLVESGGCRVINGAFGACIHGAIGGQ